jgi:hypothetical protein
MSDIVLFQMCSWRRKSLIEGHRFYVDQARKRLLSQFENIEEEAEKASEEWLERSSCWFDPDRHDPGDFYESANDAGIEFYELLSGMRDQTWLSVVAGMFHEWDKQLREWLVREVEHWHHGEDLPKKLWSADFLRICDFLESLGWNLHGSTWFRTLNACRLVVNVYKHGAGNSLDELKDHHPEYLCDPLRGLRCDFLGNHDPVHTDLRVSEDQFREFSDAIIACWTTAPENIWDSKISDVPDWIMKAIEKDLSKRQKTSST